MAEEEEEESSIVDESETVEAEMVDEALLLVTNPNFKNKIKNQKV